MHFSERVRSQKNIRIHKDIGQQKRGGIEMPGYYLPSLRDWGSTTSSPPSHRRSREALCEGDRSTYFLFGAGVLVYSDDPKGGRAPAYRQRLLPAHRQR